MTGRSPQRRPLIGNARSAAVEVLLQVYETGAYANRAAENVLGGMRLEPRDRMFALAVVYGTLARTRTLDHVLGSVARRPLERMEPAVRTILRIGVWQLLYSRSVPARAACSESVLLARHYANPGAAGMVNGILRRLASDLPDPDTFPFALRNGLPDWIAEGLRAWMPGARAEQVAEASNRIPPLAVRINAMRTDRESLIRRLKSEAVSAAPGAFHPEALVLELGGQPLTELPSFKEGLFMVQDEAAMLVSTIAAPQAGEQIADLCSAPGGKACHMAEITSDKARITAGDIHESRLTRITENTKRLGIRSVRPVALDAAETGLPSASFDRILCDVPCSGLGLLARKPEIRFRVKQEDIPGLACIQSQILDEAVRLLKPGGTLVYSTCTLHPEENENQTARFLARHGGGMEPYGFADRIPPALSARDPSTAEDAAAGQLRLLPGVHGGDGFFIARFIKRGRT